MWQPIQPRRRRTAIVASLLVLVTACGPGGNPGASTGPGPATSTVAPDPTDPPSVAPSAPATADLETARPIAELGSRLIATIDGIAQPCAMVATATDVWVTGNGPSMLARIDPDTNTIVSQAPIGGSPCGIALGSDGRLWVALLSIGQVVAVDPATGATEASVDGLGSQLWDLKSGFDAIWVVDRSHRELVRIEPDSATVAARIAIGASGSGLAIAAGAVWVVDDVDGSVRRIDPATNAVTATAELRRGASWFANDDRTLLVTNRLDGSLTPIETADAGPGEPLDGGASPLDGTIVDGRAYVPDGRSGTVVEVDLQSLTVAAVSRLDGAKNPFVAEVVFDDLWVLDYGGKRIWRISR